MDNLRDIMNHLRADIAALQAENADKDKEIEGLTQKATLNAFVKYAMKRACEDLVGAEAALSKVEAERDAVVRDLGYQDGSMCNYCQQGGDCDVTAQAYIKNKGSCFKWRGLRGVGK